MLVRFWGTRGSIPFALTSADIRRKVEAALSLAIARGVNSIDKPSNDERIQSIPNETIRFEILTRHGRSLIVNAAFDGMEIDV